MVTLRILCVWLPVLVFMSTARGQEPGEIALTLSDGALPDGALPHRLLPHLHGFRAQVWPAEGGHLPWLHAAWYDLGVHFGVYCHDCLTHGRLRHGSVGTMEYEQLGDGYLIDGTNDIGFMLGSDGLFDSNALLAPIPTEQVSPRISARTHDDTLGNQIDNVSTPARWTKFRYSGLQLTVAIPSDQPPTAIRFWHNGEAAHPDLIAADGDWTATVDNARLIFERNFQWNNPPLGKSNLQVEAKIGDQWSRLSQPLHIEIVPPQSPVIVAVGNQNSQLMPWSKFSGVIPSDSNLFVQLANLTPGMTVLADVDHYGSITGRTLGADTVVFDLSAQLTSGRYRMTLRYAPTAPEQAGAIQTQDESIVGTAALTSLRSDPFWIDFHEHLDQVFIENQYAAIQHRALNAWLSSTPSVAIAEALGGYLEQAGERHNTASVSDISHPNPHYQTRLERSRPSRNAASQMLVKLQDPNIVVNKDVDPPASPSDHRSVETTPNADVPMGYDKLSLLEVQAKIQQSLQGYQQWKAIREQIKDSIQSHEFVTDVSFDTPATFPRRTYGPSAQEYAGNGLVILQGMRLRVAASGEYCLTFRYIPPQVPCIVQLQLQVKTQEDGPWHSLTIAPMTLKAVRDLDQPMSEVSYQTQGSSHVLARAAGDVVEIRRRASATFGFGQKILQANQQ